MISVIVPIYNTGKKLNKCLLSLLNQTYKDWECFLVNDCSTDKTTIRLLNEWSKKDKRFVLINNSRNLGIEKTRFVAVARILSEDKSEYIMFMDHDDWLYSNTSLSYLYENAYKSGADVTIGRHNEAYGLVQRPGFNPIESRLIEQPELKEKYYFSYFGVNLMPVLVWARLYKVDIIKRANMKPHGLVYADDVAWNLFIMPYAHSVLMLEKVVYVHRWGGLSSKANTIGLEEYKKFYMIKRLAFIDFDFNEGRFFVDCEMKNVLAASIFNSIVYLNMSKLEIIEWLKTELSDNIWEDVDETIKNRDDEFSQALYNRDFEQMYYIQYKNANSLRFKLRLLLRKCVSLIIK